MTYGQAPVNLGLVTVYCSEMMFYQDLPIKLIGASLPVVEKGVEIPFRGLISHVACNYIGAYGLDAYMNSYMYISCKNLYQPGGC